LLHDFRKSDLAQGSWRELAIWLVKNSVDSLPICSIINGLFSTNRFFGHSQPVSVRSNLEHGMDPTKRPGQQGKSRKLPGTTFHGTHHQDSENAGGFQLVCDEPPELVEASNRYEIAEELGRGGMGVVYRARDLKLNRDVAVKLLRSEYADQPRIVAQFENEIRIMGSLQHPGIAHVYECGITNDERPFFVMKLIKGMTLHSLLNAHAANKQDRARLLNIFSSVCQALAYTHSQDVVHLDLKPANIMVGAFGEVHLMDWGLARSLAKPTADASNASLGVPDNPVDPDNNLTHPNRVHGTLSYMAPEQARGEQVNKRTDVFCLGAILCEILTGQPPYLGEERVDILDQAQRGALRPALCRLDECDREFAQVRLAKRCLQAAPEARPADATAVAADMAAYNETALERAESDMTRFFELSLDLFCIASFDGFFRRINSNFSRVLGYSEAELLSRPFLDFVHPDDREKTTNVMGRLLEGQPVVRFQNRYCAANGEIFDFEWTAKSIISENLIFAVARNVN
jgi:serine/threonine-protein kinase